ncbi:MAG: PcfJ domain-containing protein [Sulfurospirillum sp.]|nr:PcfJ domain-containing protein [Sulfurospirillum sp.]
MDVGNRFDHTFIHTLTQHIQDTNLAKELIGLKFNDFFDSKRAAPYWNTFFIFLLSHVNERKIVSLLKQYAEGDNWWLLDTMQILDAIIDNGDYETIEEHIQAISKAKKYSCIGIHNLLLTHLRKIIADKNVNLIFTYSEKTTEPCIQSDIYEIRLPKTGLELNAWGELLHNCLAGYCNRVMERESFIYGFFQETQLQFAVEVQNDKIIQASSKYNAPLSNEQKRVLDAWHQRFFVKDTHTIIAN